MNILLTGGTGYVGSHVADKLVLDHAINLISATRRDCSELANPCTRVASLDAHTDWSTALRNQQVVIHCAARAHVMRDEVFDPLLEYRRVNVEGTLNLAKQAAAAGVKRFIFISTIKVNGEQTSIGKPFTADDPPAPKDAYGISKFEAEQGLQQLASECGMEVVIIRPPMVYGPGVKGNFASMINTVSKGLPLPFGAIHNRRSLLAVGNLVDLIVTCIGHPGAANQVFLASDGQDLSTSQLMRGVAVAMSVPSRLVPIHVNILNCAAMLLGKKDVAQRLFGSLQVDITKTRELLGWVPPVSVEEGLRRCFVSEIQ